MTITQLFWLCHFTKANKFHAKSITNNVNMNDLEGLINPCSDCLNNDHNKKKSKN